MVRTTGRESLIKSHQKRTLHYIVFYSVAQLNNRHSKLSVKEKKIDKKEKDIKEKLRVENLLE